MKRAKQSIAMAIVVLISITGMADAAFKRTPPQTIITLAHVNADRKNQGVCVATTPAIKDAKGKGTAVCVDENRSNEGILNQLLLQAWKELAECVIGYDDVNFKIHWVSCQ